MAKSEPLHEILYPVTVAMVEHCAREAHEANRNYCYALGDTSQVPWAEAPEWQRASIREGVRGVFDGLTPEQSHVQWCHRKLQEGWSYGEAKDPEQKTHPCLRPYAELPPEQRFKDTLFAGAARFARCRRPGVYVAPKAWQRLSGETLYDLFRSEVPGAPPWEEVPEKARGNWEAIGVFHDGPTRFDRRVELDGGAR